MERVIDPSDQEPSPASTADRRVSKQPGAQHNLVLGPAEGEQLVHFRDQGSICVKFGAATGSNDLALGTQQVLAGAGIPLHRHLRMDEAFYVLKGYGTVVIDDVRYVFEPGATIFIPKHAWHGFENPDHDLLLLWIVSPAGLDGFFRDTCSSPGMPETALSQEQIRAIAWRYDTEFK